MARSYQEAGDGYWRAVQRELPVFASAFDRALPVIDVALPGGEVLEVPCDYFLFERAA